MQEPRYLNDDRYPGPSTHPCPSYIQGLPTQAELDTYPRMFTWGELKEIITSGELERLMRNKQMQERYDIWSMGIKGEYESTEKYLTRARLPWSSNIESASTAQSTYPPSDSPHHENGSSSSSSHLQPSSRSAPSDNQSGTSTPSSAGFVSLDTLKDLLGQKKQKRDGSNRINGHVKDQEGSLGGENGDPEVNDDDAEEDKSAPEFLRYDPCTGLDPAKYAVLFNDWPYNVPYGVRHYCVWSKVPIAHPHLVNYDPTAWSSIESEGLGGLTGITPTRNIWAEASTYSNRPLTSASTSSPTYPPLQPLPRPINKPIPSSAKRGNEWFAIDQAFGGNEMRRWAGVNYEAKGGQEVGRMVRALWDERGWECIWFVNPPRLQSVPGFSHFHVFARRKTPEEIDTSERCYSQSL